MRQDYSNQSVSSATNFACVRAIALRSYYAVGTGTAGGGGVGYEKKTATQKYLAKIPEFFLPHINRSIVDAKVQLSELECL